MRKIEYINGYTNGIIDGVRHLRAILYMKTNTFLRATCELKTKIGMRATKHENQNPFAYKMGERNVLIRCLFTTFI